MKIIKLEEINSTNEFLKTYTGTGDAAAVAVRQTGGKGTKGRKFVSEKGGLYLSVMRRYDCFPAEDAFKIMVSSSVAVCRTLEILGLNPIIKWANDVFVNGKKICGTLIENTFSNGHIVRSIVGIGINVNNVISPEISEIAISVKDILKKQTDLDYVLNILLENLQNEYKVDDYKRYINWFNTDVLIKTEDGERKVKALDVTEKGALLVDWCGNMLEINAAEVSLKL